MTVSEGGDELLKLLDADGDRPHLGAERAGDDDLGPVVGELGRKALRLVPLALGHRTELAILDTVGQRDHSFG